MKTVTIFNKSKEKSSLQCTHLIEHNHSIGQDMVWLLSAQTIIHGLIHLVSLIPILFGAADWHHHDNHVYEMGEAITYSVILNILLHISLTVMLVIAQKIRVH